MSLALADAPVAESQYRERFNGEIFAMGGGAWEHSVISSHLSRWLGNCPSGRRCLVADKDLKIKVGLTGLIPP